MVIGLFLPVILTYDIKHVWSFDQLFVMYDALLSEFDYGIKKGRFLSIIRFSSPFLLLSYTHTPYTCAHLE